MSAIFSGLKDPSRSIKHGTDPSIKKDNVRCDEERVEDSVRSVNLTPAQEKKIWRRIDLRLVPIITVIYLFAFMDRGMYPQRNVFACLYRILMSRKYWCEYRLLICTAFSFFEKFS